MARESANNAKPRVGALTEASSFSLFVIARLDRGTLVGIDVAEDIRDHNVGEQTALRKMKVLWSGGVTEVVQRTAHSSRTGVYSAQGPRTGVRSAKIKNTVVRNSVIVYDVLLLIFVAHGPYNQQDYGRVIRS